MEQRISWLYLLTDIKKTFHDLLLKKNVLDGLCTGRTPSKWPDHYRKSYIN